MSTVPEARPESTAVRERPASSGARNGGMPARRAVIRWAWRLLRREWRQQLLIFALITVAVAATFVGAAVATNTPASPGAGFGTAQDMAVFPGADPRLAAQIAALAHRFRPVDVIENQPMAVISAARFGNVLDYAGPNLAPNQVIVYLPGNGPDGGPGPGAGLGGPGGPSGGAPARSHSHGKLIKRSAAGTGSAPPPSVLASQARTAREIAAVLGARDAITLYQPDATIVHAAAGRNWHGPVYVGTPQLLAAFGIKTVQVSPGADVLTMRPGLDTLVKMQLTYGSYNGPPGYRCPASTCLANPTIEEVGALPSGTDAPNTVITEHAVRELGLTVAAAGWLIQAPSAPTASQVYHATQIAAAAGMTIERRDNIPSLAQIVSVATAFAILLTLCIVAMSVGLVRSETASDLRILTATGASGSTRRTLVAVTAGALALAGAVAGTAGGYLAAISFLRTNHLDTLSALRSVPVASLLAILVGMPLAAVIGGWLLAGREPSGIARQPLA